MVNTQKLRNVSSFDKATKKQGDNDVQLLHVGYDVQLT